MFVKQWNFDWHKWNWMGGLLLGSIADYIASWLLGWLMIVYFTFLWVENWKFPPFNQSCPLRLFWCWVHFSGVFLPPFVLLLLWLHITLDNNFFRVLCILWSFYANFILRFLSCIHGNEQPPPTTTPRLR